MSVELEKRQFNVDEYYRMAAVGVLTPDDRVELIDGEIIKMSPIGSPHAACVSRLNHLLQASLRDRVIISVQNPVRLSQFSEPVSDIAVLKRREDFYSARHPTPEDVLLIIEVGEASVLTDKRIKLPLYARSSVQELWLINIPKQTVEAFCDPTPDGYRESKRYGRGELVIANTIRDLSVAVDDVFGRVG